ncbi:MAG TPA: FAD-dependent oxidoreductase [Baekduia sp.]|uniref:FAD-dependent oxidoreductase n=1 Tax=Baekduia sp. TaxID=2600305 RepID=UPI002C47F898|nr:FAD-dependent oxidoreductase [Baekduia sp.]HMJ36864.1 FAD-dependent oxidoreductase [Baekduia sp.]
MSGRDVGIVGGGLLGVGIAYRLARAGVKVTLYERDARLGGLAGTTDLGGYDVDRYYHAVLPTDDRVLALAEEVGLEEESVRMRRLGVGFFHDGRLASMSTPKELLTFPGLAMRDRMALVGFVARCQLRKGHADLEDVPLEGWLRRMAGDRLWDRLWRPLLESKFDGRYHDLPATYMWSRMRRTAGTRDRSGQEVMGWIHGGYQELVDRLGAEVGRRGGEILLDTRVGGIPSQDGRALGVVIDGRLRPHDLVVTTQLRPTLETLVSEELAGALGPDRNRYLGIVCLVMRVKRSVSPYYALNITDRSVPITSIVETTHAVDPEAVGGHLVYVPHYVDPSNPELDRSSAEITREFTGHVRRIFPHFDPADVLASQVARTRMAEPVHTVGVAQRAGDLFPAPGLAVASSARIYPEIVNGQAILGVSDHVAEQIVNSTSGQARLRAA